MSQSTKCLCARLPIIREVTSQNPQLPDELIEMIMAKCLPSELVSYGWDRVSHSLTSSIHRQLCAQKVFCALEDPLWELFQATGYGYDSHKFDKLLVLLMKKYLCEVSEMILPISLFSHIQHLVTVFPYLSATSGTACKFRLPRPGFTFPNLSKLTVKIGSECGGLSLTHNFENLKTSSCLCKTLSEINIDLLLSDSEDVTCSGFREFLRYLKEIASSSTIWNIRLKDNTTSGQKWSDPSSLNRYRNKMFVCYVRSIIDSSLIINQLEFFDEKKDENSRSERAMYMFPEFKKCRHLVIRYDIGLIAPSITHANVTSDELKTCKIIKSRIYYKSELIEFLKTADDIYGDKMQVQ